MDPIGGWAEEIGWSYLDRKRIEKLGGQTIGIVWPLVPFGGAERDRTRCESVPSRFRPSACRSDRSPFGVVELQDPFCL